MTPAARVQAAIDALDCWGAGVPVEQALTNWARGARYAGSGDRAAVRDHVYDVLRARGSCAALGGSDTGRALMLGLLRMQRADPGTLFTGARHAPAALSHEEAAHRAIASDPSVDVPAWCLPLLGAVAGARLPDLLATFRHRAPLYLRVNRQKGGLEQTIARLAQDGIIAEADTRAPTALVVTSGARRLKASGVYADGWIEPQDLSVQRAIAAVAWPPGRILDFCAGGGGKALAIADACAAQVMAHDASPARMADLPARAARAGVSIGLLDRVDVARAAPFDAVLCDVPCSGSGTWRRNPEAKWRLTPARLADLRQVQATILREAAPLVAPGGLLVYMTCSLFNDENIAQISRFLAENAGWVSISQQLDTPLTASDGFFHTALRAPA